MTERGDELMGWNNPHDALEGARAPAPAACPGADDAPVSRRKRAPTEARAIEPTRRPVTPYAELHCHSHFSFLDGASSPAELVEEAVRLGLHALAITDHDGFYGAPMLAEAAAAYEPAHRLRRRAVARAERPAERRARPRGQPPAGAGAGRRGLPPARRGDDRRPPARRREGPTRLRPRRAGRAGARPLGWCSPAAARARCGRRSRRAASRGGRGARPADVAVRARPRASVELSPAHPAPTRPTPRSPGWPPSTASPSSRPATSTTPPRSGTGWPRRWRRCGPGAASPSIDGWLDLSGSAHLRSGAEMAAALRRYPDAVARSVTLADELAFDLRKASPAAAQAAASPRGTPPTRGCGCWRERGFAERYAGVAARARGARADRARAAGHRREGLRRLLRHRPRHRRLRPRAGGSSARAAARRPARRSATPSASPRSTRSSTGCPSSGSSPRTATRSPTSTSTSTPTGARRSSSGSTTPTAAATPPRSPTSSAYRPRMAVRDAAKALGYSPGQQDAWSKQIDGWNRWSPATRATRRPRRARPGGGAGRGADGRPAPPRHPLRRDGAHRAADRRGLPDRAGPDGPAHRAAVGQGRLRVDGAGQVRPARARACSARSTT